MESTHEMVRDCGSYGWGDGLDLFLKALHGMAPLIHTRHTYRLPFSWRRTAWTHKVGKRYLSESWDFKSLWPILGVLYTGCRRSLFVHMSLYETG